MKFGNDRRLIDGRRYSIQRNHLGSHAINNIRVTIVILEDMQFWIVALNSFDEHQFLPRGPFPTNEVAYATARMMS